MPLTASRVVITPADGLLASPAKSQKATVTLMHQGPGSIFVGGSGVTAAVGFELTPSVPLTIEIDVDDEVHGITASGNVSVSVLRID